MKKYKMLALLLIGTMFAQVNDGPIQVTASGEVPFVVSFNTQAGDGGQDTGVDATTTAGNFALVTDDDYDRVTAQGVTNYYNIPDVIAIADFDANHYVKCYLTKGSWTIPSGYGGAKASDATDNTGLITVGDFTSTDYTGLDENANLIITGGLATHGVEDAVFDVDARVLFDWLTDIPGIYSVQLTLTVTDGS